ncbi:hypothetical protein B0H16DRAFT_1693734 [Mycena metata]|uniref:Uncharacterized protein n=1 Tax=Mycena metata TaxID=1033252 RepID=A0AAD7IGF4_9AGAR|nr:hypothetical protein B0H16DRAFT_1693734 [Mycena metata]
MDPQNPTYYFPSGPPVPPYQFYGAPPAPYYGPAPGDMGFDRPHPAPSAPTEHARSRSPDLAPSPAKAPVKRGRGRPPGSGKKKKVAAKTAAKVAVVKSKAPSVKQAKKSKKTDEEKENQVPIDIDDSDSEAEGGNKYTHWADSEKTDVFSFILAFDDTGNHRFEQLKKNPARVFKRASEILFPAGNRSVKSIQNLWTRSMDTYTWIRAFEGFTGNGGGDPDSEDPTAILAHRLVAARKASLSVGKLKAETIVLWEQQGWLELSNGRYGNNAKVTRTVVRNSASAISDIEDNADDTRLQLPLSY